MSAVEKALERVKTLPEDKARLLLRWLDSLEEAPRSPATEPAGAVAALGYARRFHPPRTTAEWLHELREGEE